MEVLESAVERYDRLILSGVLILAPTGIAQWCFACRQHLVHRQPEKITHAAIDRLAEAYSEHSAQCFWERHGQRL